MRCHFHTRSALKLIATLLLLTSLGLMTSSANSSTAIPDTPAGQVLADLAAAMRSGDQDRVRAFSRKHGSNEEAINRRLWTQLLTGGWKILRIAKSEPGAITAYAVENKREIVVKLELTLRSIDPPMLDKFIGIPQPDPTELGLTRQSEAQAVAALAQKMDLLAKEDAFSGTVQIVRHGKVLFQNAYGFADRESKKPNTLQTQFRVGSITKMFTAVTMLQLVEAGKASLDDKVGKFLPDYPNDAIRTKVTIRHLLTHTGGTGDMFSDEQLAKRDSLKEHSDYVAFFGEREPLFEPGSRYEYSNYGYLLLARLIEVISGMNYYDYVEKKVFIPAGMTTTASRPESEHVPMRAVGYTTYDGGLESSTKYLTYRGMAAGNAYSTVEDLFKFSEALASGKLISPSLFKEATRRQTDVYGYGFGVYGDGKLLRYGHAGGFPGVSGDVRIYPNTGYSVISLSNFDFPTAEIPTIYFENRMPLD